MDLERVSSVAVPQALKARGTGEGQGSWGRPGEPAGSGGPGGAVSQGGWRGAFGRAGGLGAGRLSSSVFLIGPLARAWGAGCQGRDGSAEAFSSYGGFGCFFFFFGVFFFVFGVFFPFFGVFFSFWVFFFRFPGF